MELALSKQYGQTGQMQQGGRTGHVDEEGIIDANTDTVIGNGNGNDNDTADVDPNPSSSPDMGTGTGAESVYMTVPESVSSVFNNQTQAQSQSGHRNSNEYMKQFLSIYKQDQDALNTKLDRLATTSSVYELSKQDGGLSGGIDGDVDVVITERNNPTTSATAGTTTGTTATGAAAIYANSSQAELNRLLPKPMPPWLPSKVCVYV